MNQVFWFEHLETELPSADMREQLVGRIGASEGEAFSYEHIELEMPFTWPNGNTDWVLDI